MISVSDPKRLFPDPTFKAIPEPDPIPDPVQNKTLKRQFFLLNPLETFTIGTVVQFSQIF